MDLLPDTIQTRLEANMFRRSCKLEDIRYLRTSDFGDTCKSDPSMSPNLETFTCFSPPRTGCENWKYHVSAVILLLSFKIYVAHSSAIIENRSTYTRV